VFAEAVPAGRGAAAATSSVELGSKSVWEYEVSKKRVFAARDALAQWRSFRPLGPRATVWGRVRRKVDFG